MKSKRNKDPLLYLLIATPFLIIMNGGIVVVAIMWFAYFAWCSRNIDDDRQEQIRQDNVRYELSKKIRQAQQELESEE